MQRQAIFISWSTGRDGSVSIHERNLRFVATVNEQNRYELRNGTDFAVRAVNPVRYGLEIWAI